MFSLRKKSLRILVFAILIFVIAVATYGFAAANTVTGGTAYMGEGSGTIAGFSVAVNSYTVDLANPSVITAVSLNLTPDTTADTVYVSMDSGSDWYTCTDSGGNANPWTCDLSSGSESVTAATSITVYADGASYTVADSTP